MNREIGFLMAESKLMAVAFTNRISVDKTKESLTSLAEALGVDCTNYSRQPIDFKLPVNNNEEVLTAHIFLNYLAASDLTKDELETYTKVIFEAIATQDDVSDLTYVLEGINTLTADKLAELFNCDTDSLTSTIAKKYWGVTVEDYEIDFVNTLIPSGDETIVFSHALMINLTSKLILHFSQSVYNSPVTVEMLETPGMNDVIRALSILAKIEVSNVNPDDLVPLVSETILGTYLAHDGIGTTNALAYATLVDPDAANLQHTFIIAGLLTQSPYSLVARDLLRIVTRNHSTASKIITANGVSRVLQLLGISSVDQDGKELEMLSAVDGDEQLFKLITPDESPVPTHLLIECTLVVNRHFMENPNPFLKEEQPVE